MAIGLFYVALQNILFRERKTPLVRAGMKASVSRNASERRGDSLLPLIFALLYYLYVKGKSKYGQITLLCLLLIGFSRFFLEMLRGDSVYLGSFAIAQIISALFICASFVLLILFEKEKIRAGFKRTPTS